MDNKNSLTCYNCRLYNYNCFPNDENGTCAKFRRKYSCLYCKNFKVYLGETIKVTKCDHNFFCGDYEKPQYRNFCRYFDFDEAGVDKDNPRFRVQLTPNEEEKYNSNVSKTIRYNKRSMISSEIKKCSDKFFNTYERKYLVEMLDYIICYLNMRDEFNKEFGDD